MKTALKFWAAVLGSLVLFWGLLSLYDLIFTNGDGLLGRANLDLLLGYSLFGVIGLAIVTIGTRSPRRWVANVSASLCGLLFFWMLAEIVCFGLIRSGLSEASPPFHSRMWLSKNWNASATNYWGDYSPKFGRWRQPHSAFSLPICNGDTVLLTSNSFGMRDGERQLDNPSGEKRAVLIGDSFMEGYVVDAPQRYSNRLEAKSGREHLNFGINGTSPIDYYLIYKYLASRFVHDVVIISLLPANDFESYTESDELSLLQYPIYRPYWRGKYPRVDLAYSLADIRQSIASPVRYGRPALVQQSVDSVFRSLPVGKKLSAEIRMNSYVYSYIRHGLIKAASQNNPPVGSFSQAALANRWAGFSYSLEALLRIAKGKKVILLGMPILSDLQAYDRSQDDYFSAHIEALCERHGASYLSLLSVFHAQGAGSWQSLYIPCDGHLSARGEKLVADALIAFPAYRQAMGLDTTVSVPRRYAAVLKRDSTQQL